MKLKIFTFPMIMCLCGTICLNAQEEKSPLDKKSAFVALLVSFSNTEKENSKNLLENVDYSKVTNFSVRSAGGYFIKKYLALGMGFDYTSEKEDSDNVNTFGPNSIIDKQVETFTITPFMRNYIAIGAKERFFLFTQTGLEFSFGDGDEAITTGDNFDFSDIRRREYGLAFTPGVILIVQKGFAFEVNVGVLGFRRSKETITPTDGVETIVTKTNFNFDIDLLSLKLGISYYF